LIKVSVVIPVYNVEKYIRECLESLINQTLNEIEIILINDSSTDSSGEICKEYASKDSRIVLINNTQNIGSGFSRNAGIDIAKGEYLGFVDPDDWIDLDFYEKLYEKAKSEDLDIAKASCSYVFEEQNNRVASKPCINKKIEKGLKNNIPVFINFHGEHWSAIYKTDLQRRSKARYPNIRNSQDDVFLLMIAFFCKSIGFVENKFYHYRIHGDSVVHRTDAVYYDSQIKRIELQLEFLNSKTLDDNIYFMFTYGIFIHVIRKLIPIFIGELISLDKKIEYINSLSTVMSKNRIIEFIKIELKSLKYDQLDHKKIKLHFFRLLDDFFESVIETSKKMRLANEELNLIFQDYYLSKIKLLEMMDNNFIQKQYNEYLILFKMLIKYPIIFKLRMFWYFSIFKYILRYEFK
jgi:glycosyltransferase involved in cell wall biosynthesis